MEMIKTMILKTAPKPCGAREGAVAEALAARVTAKARVEVVLMVGATGNRDSSPDGQHL